MTASIAFEEIYKGADFAVTTNSSGDSVITYDMSKKAAAAAASNDAGLTQLTNSLFEGAFGTAQIANISASMYEDPMAPALNAADMSGIFGLGKHS